MNRVFTLVITDSAYMDVHCFYGDSPPLVEQMLSQIDFTRSAELVRLLEQLREKISCHKHADYTALKYTDANKEYLFHMKCHHPEEAGFKLIDS